MFINSKYQRFFLFIFSIIVVFAINLEEAKSNTLISKNRIISGEFATLERKLYLLSEVNGTKRVIAIDLSNCNTENQFPIDKSSINFQISEYVQSYAYIGGKSLQVFNLVSGKVDKNFNDFIRSVHIISQSDMGEYIAASDGLSVSLYNFTKNGINKLYSKDFLNGVISVYPDIEHKKLYVAEQNGILSTWSFDGKLLKNLNLEINVYDIIFDKKMGRLLFNSNSGLYSFDKEKNTINKLLNNKQKKVIIEPYSSRLKILTDKGFVVYDYPVMRPVMIQNGSFGNIIKNDGGDFAAFNQINFVKVYNLKRNAQIATIALVNPGVIKFIPASDNYGGNISTAFIDAANPDKDDETFETMLSQDNVCANLSAMISGVYTPNFNQLNDVKIKDVKAVDDVAEPTVSEPTEAKGPVFTFRTGNHEVKDPKNPSFNSNVKEPSVAANAHNPDMVKAPTNPNVDNLTSLLPTNVPNWIANRKNLPINNTVATSNSESDALKLGKSQVKNNLLKDVLKTIVKDESLKAITDINVKKRILYQAASEAINNSPIKTKDTWVSPAKQYYIHLELDNKNIDSLGKLYLSKEIEKYNKMGNKEYMSIKPNTLD